MVTYDELIERLPEARPNGDSHRIPFTCVLCKSKDAYVLIKHGEIFTNCAGCFQALSLGEALRLTGETLAEGQSPPPLEPEPASNESQKAEPPASKPRATAPSSLVGYAIAYARKGYRVFPCHEIESDRECSCGKLGCGSAGKHPRFTGWQEAATTDEGRIRAWWGEYPTANIGVACGEKSNLTVLDVDVKPHKGVDGRPTLSGLEQENGELPETPIVITGSGFGGVQYYFQYEPEVSNEVGFAHGLDTRNEGGLVVGVGSLTRQRYTWDAIATLADNFRPSKMPRWLVEAIKAAGAPANNGPLVVPEIIPDGERNKWLYKLGRSLKARGMSPASIQAALREENRTKCRPVAPDADVDAIAKHVCEQADSAAFTALVAKTNTLPANGDEFEGRHAISAYDAWINISQEPVTYAIDKLLRFGHTIGLSGLMGSGKTTMLMWLVRCLALGEPFLGRDTVQGSVLAIISSKEYDNWAEAVGFWDLRSGIFLMPSHDFHWNSAEKAARHFQHEMDNNGCRYFALDTLFDFFGMTGNRSGDENRNIMNEQAPLLSIVREQRFAGIVSGHVPKSEAQAEVPRDPEEAFAGNTGWMAQHRMRATLRRKSKKGGFNALITGKGGYGDEGFLEEQLVVFDEQTRAVSLGGLFSQHLGAAAFPEVLGALQETGEWMSRKDIETRLGVGKGKNWVLAGLKHGMKQISPPAIDKTGSSSRTAYRAIDQNTPVQNPGLFGSSSTVASPSSGAGSNYSLGISNATAASADRDVCPCGHTVHEHAPGFSECTVVGCDCQSMYRKLLNAGVSPAPTSRRSWTGCPNPQCRYHCDDPELIYCPACGADLQRTKSENA